MQLTRGTLPVHRWSPQVAGGRRSQKMLDDARAFIMDRMRILSLFCLPLIPAIGCDATAPAPDGRPFSSADQVDADPGGPSDRATDATEHDFGQIVAEGQALRHEFAFSNPGDRPIHLLGATALTPCCSAIGPLPESIPPGGTAKLPMVFEPGVQGGRKRVEFVVRTDDPGRPDRVFAAVASLIASIDIEVLKDSDRSLLIGQGGDQRYTVTCRRLGARGLAMPDDVEATPPLDARFDGPTREHRGAGDLIETRRDVIVRIPATAEVGAHRGELRLHWSEGPTRSHPIA